MVERNIRLLDIISSSLIKKQRTKLSNGNHDVDG